MSAPMTPAEGQTFETLLAAVQMANVEMNDHGRECSEIEACNTCADLHLEETRAEKRLADFHARELAAEREAGRREQAEKDAKIAQMIGCRRRRTDGKELPGCGEEVAFAIRQEAEEFERRVGK